MEKRLDAVIDGPEGGNTSQFIGVPLDGYASVVTDHDCIIPSPPGTSYSWYSLKSIAEVEFVQLAGTVTTGGVVSPLSKTTVTVNVPVPTFPAASVAVHVMVVVPTGNK